MDLLTDRELLLPRDPSGRGRLGDGRRVLAGTRPHFFGILVVVAAASHGAADALTVSDGAGPLSGKGLAATAAWLVAWPALHLTLRHREVPWRATMRVVAALVAVGLLLTFPPLYQWIAGE